MKLRMIFYRLAFAMIIVFSTSSLSITKEIKPSICNGAYKSKVLGKDFTEIELRRVLETHTAWLKLQSAGDENSRDVENNLNVQQKANLCGVTFGNVNLSNEDLSESNFSGASFWGADLSKVNFFEANLSGAKIKGSNLTGAHLILVNLSGSSLNGSNLSDVVFFGADLTGADFTAVNLSNVTSFENTNFDDVWFEPKVESISPVRKFYDANNLHKLRYRRAPHALIELRRLFREVGMSHRARELTYAIKHTEIEKVFNFEDYKPLGPQIDKDYIPSFGEWVEAVFKLIFFDLTTQWGMNSGRALIALFTLIPLFSVPYVIALKRKGSDGIWLEWSDKRVRMDIGHNQPTQLNVGWWKAISMGLYFSILSAFHIGWRDFNVGSWIARMQPREYTLRASGWIRTMSGVQSLISVYLVAIWVLTYFGHPFE